MQPSPTSLDNLLEHADWVRALARSLVRDAAKADDLAQEVWLEALRRGPTDDRNLRGWLRTLARRLAGHGRERERRAVVREELAAVSERLPATDELAERAAIQRELTEHVLILKEDYRRVLLLRYWEDLAPREIAARDRLPIATVKTRLQRAKAELRERLQSEHGSEGRWCLALAPIIGTETLERVSLISQMASSPAKAAGVVAATGALATFASLGWDAWKGEAPSSNTTDPFTQSSSSDVRPLGSNQGRLEPLQSTTERQAPVSSPSASLTKDAAAAPTTWRASTTRLVDVDGNPLPGLRLRKRVPASVRWHEGDPIWIGDEHETLRLTLDAQARLQADPEAMRAFCEQQRRPAEWRATLEGTAIAEREVISDPAGYVEAAEPTKLDLVEPGWTLAGYALKEVAEPTGSPESEPVLYLVACRSFDFAGLVQGPSGEALTEARVRVEWPEIDMLASSPALSFQLPPFRRESPGECRADSKGRFILRDAPAIEGARWSAIALEHEPAGGELPGREERGAHIVLQRLDPSTPRIEGTVTGPDGRGLADAEVRLGEWHQRTGENGSFTLLVPGRSESMPLIVWAPGHIPIIDPNAGSELAARSDRRIAGDYTLAHGLHALHGRVVDESGHPLGNALIGLLEPTQLANTLTSIEGRVGGRGLTVESDLNGAFVLSGLFQPHVRLRVFHAASRTSRVTDLIDVRATGSLPVHVILGSQHAAVSARGRLIFPASTDPKPVRIMTGFDWLRSRDGLGSVFESSELLPIADDGSFVLPALFRDHAWIMVLNGHEKRRFETDNLNLGQPVELHW